VRREGIEPPTPLIKISQRRSRGGRSWACEGAHGALWTPANVTAMLSLLLSGWTRATACVSAKVRLPESSR
jgi:hypothetical protein